MDGPSRLALAPALLSTRTSRGGCPRMGKSLPETPSVRSPLETTTSPFNTCDLGRKGGGSAHARCALAHTTANLSIRYRSLQDDVRMPFIVRATKCAAGFWSKTLAKHDGCKGHGWNKHGHVVRPHAYENVDRHLHRQVSVESKPRLLSSQQLNVMSPVLHFHPQSSWITCYCDSKQ